MWKQLDEALATLQKVDGSYAPAQLVQSVYSRLTLAFVDAGLPDRAAGVLEAQKASRNAARREGPTLSPSSSSPNSALARLRSGSASINKLSGAITPPAGAAGAGASGTTTTIAAAAAGGAGGVVGRTGSGAAVRSPLASRASIKRGGSVSFAASGAVLAGVEGDGVVPVAADGEGDSVVGGDGEDDGDDGDDGSGAVDEDDAEAIAEADADGTGSEMSPAVEAEEMYITLMSSYAQQVCNACAVHLVVTAPSLVCLSARNPWVG